MIIVFNFAIALSWKYRGHITEIVTSFQSIVGSNK
jgi:hypothetical protein